MAILFRTREALSLETKKKSIHDLLNNSSPDSDFYLLLIGAAVLAIGAIFTDSVVVLIASMIIAPLGLGIVARSWHTIVRAGSILLIATAVTLLLAALSTFIVPEVAPDKYINFTGHRITAFIVAVVSGLIAAYGMIKPKVATVVTGVAIAVSLLPPLVASGINYATGNTTIGYDAFIMFLLNIAGILCASIIVFWLFGMGRVYRTIDTR